MKRIWPFVAVFPAALILFGAIPAGQTPPPPNPNFMVPKATTCVVEVVPRIAGEVSHSQPKVIPALGGPDTASRLAAALKQTNRPSLSPPIILELVTKPGPTSGASGNSTKPVPLARNGTVRIGFLTLVSTHAKREAPTYRLLHAQVDRLPAVAPGRPDRLRISFQTVQTAPAIAADNNGIWHTLGG